MSGFLAQIIGFAGNPAVVQGFTGILTQLVGGAQGAAGGGLPALLQQLENAGLGQQVASWVGTGENHPVTPEQLSSALPQEHVESMAQQAGTTPDALLKMLAEALPHAVDHATPGGTVPEAEAPAPDLGALVGKLLGQR